MYLQKIVVHLKIILFKFKKMAPKFFEKWLQRSSVDDEDSQAYNVNIWFEGCFNDEYTTYCKFCNKIFSIINMRFAQTETNDKKF